MGALSPAQIQEELSRSIAVKQKRASIDQDLNAQAEVIMDRARAEVDTLRTAQKADRDALVAILADSEKRLAEGSVGGDPPNVKGFEGALKSIYANNLLALNTLLGKYPLFMWSLRDENWSFVAQMFQGAVAVKDITEEDWAKIQAAAATNNIPLA